MIWSKMHTSQDTNKPGGHDPEIVYQRIISPSDLTDAGSTSHDNYYMMDQILRFDKETGRVDG
jgi:hypothetical protein